FEFGFVLDGGDDNDVFAFFPVHRRGNAVVVRQLQGVKDAQDFVEVAACAGGVGDGKADFLVRVDDEYRAHGGGGAGVGVDHVVQLGDFVIGVGQDGVFDFGLLGVVDVFDPLAMGIGIVDG